MTLKILFQPFVFGQFILCHILNVAKFTLVKAKLLYSTDSGYQIRKFFCIVTSNKTTAYINWK